MTTPISVEKSDPLKIAELAKGRIFASCVADILGSKSSKTREEKAFVYSTPSYNGKILRKIFRRLDESKAWIEQKLSATFTMPVVFVSKDFPQICAVVGGLYLF